MQAGISARAGILERGFCGEYAVRESWKCVILKKNQNLMGSVRGGKKQYGGRSKET